MSSVLCLVIVAVFAERVATDRPPDNDRYVARAPDNPKKVCSQYFWAPCWTCS